MTSAGNRFNLQDSGYENGPNERSGPMTHGLKGILGAERAKTYNPSCYLSGDKGGAAGGYGIVSHGEGGGGVGGGVGHSPILPGGYAGAETTFEGGVRGGGVSEHETLPAQYEYPKKRGYDEHTSRAPGAGTMHGVPGVEGLHRMGMISHGEDDGGDSGDSGGGDSGDSGEGLAGKGHACPHGCGAFAKSSHGLARHIHSKHGGFKGLGKSLTRHGDSYDGKQYRGETDELSKEHEISEEFSRAAEHKDVASTYTRGDCGGSYAKMSRLAAK